MPSNRLNHCDSTLPILGICAAGSNSGKTTLITQLIPEFAKHAIRVSVIKHTHHEFDIDYPGKDSYVIREAGAVQTLVASAKRWALMTEMTCVFDGQDDTNRKEARLEELIQQIEPSYADLILVEGFKFAPVPKIEVYRSSLELPLLALHDSSIIAVVSDVKLSLNIPVFKLNDIQEIVNFIVKAM